MTITVHSQIEVFKRCSVRLNFHLFCREFMFYLCYMYLFTYTGVQYELYIRWCPCWLTVTRRVSLAEQELLTLLEHPRFSGNHVTQSSILCVVICRPLLAFLAFFSNCIICSSIYDFRLLLSVLRFTASGDFFLFLNLRLQVTSLVTSKFSFIFLFSCSTKIHRNSTFGIFWILCWTLQWSLNIENSQQQKTVESCYE